MVEKADLTESDRKKIKELLNRNDAHLYMSSEESDEGEERPENGPPSRHIKPLKWERSKLRNIKSVLDCPHRARMGKRQKQTAAKITRTDGQNMSIRPLPLECPSWAGKMPKD